MMTIDIDTISGVPFTGELKKPRPMTSAQTRKPSRKMITAAAASSTRTIQAFNFSNNCRPRKHTAGGRTDQPPVPIRRTLLDLITHRPFVAVVLGGLQRGLQHLRAGEPHG